MAETQTPLVSNVSDHRHRPATPGRPALGEGSSSSNDGGCLKVIILSAYDLPVRDPPSNVIVTVGRQTASTGPPVQRHKNRNSFKFSNANSNSNKIQIMAALPTLYPAEAQVELVYAHQPQLTLKASYPLQKLKLHESTWLILQLEPDEGRADAYDDDDEAQPTLRLQMILEGPYRTEIALFVQVANAWFHVVDTVGENVTGLLGHIPTLPDPKYVLIPAAPVLAFAVVSLPVVLGILVLGLPMFLPLLVVAGAALLAVGAAALFLAGSTPGGRRQVSSIFAPVVHTLLSTPSGQRLVYQTGPRPTPVNLAKVILPTEHIWAKLVVSLIIDAIGSASYLLPVVGEGLDVAWAPSQTILLMAMYDEVSPNLKYLSFVEEILPLTDIVPSATLGWLLQFAYPVLIAQLTVNGELADDEMSPAVVSPEYSTD